MQADKLSNYQQNYYYCKNCQSFEDYHEANGRGWCRIFNLVVREHHQTTNDCLTNGAIIQDPSYPDWELNQPKSDLAVGDRVKLIESSKEHTQWTVYTVIGQRYNHQRYRYLDAYCNEPEWYYQIISNQKGSKPFEVKENDVCLCQMSHLISTEEIF